MTQTPTSERRQSNRRKIIDQFSFYVSIPKLGASRLKVIDVSEGGVGFQIQTLGEFKLAVQSECELQFYLNQSLFLPLTIKVVRAQEENGIQMIGAIFIDTKSNEYQTLLTLVQLLDQLASFGIMK